MLSVERIKVKNWHQKSPGHYVKGDEELIIDKPMKTVIEPVYEHSRCSIVLGEAFISTCFDKPNKPRNNASHEEWDIFRKWKYMSDKDKIAYHVERYVADMGGHSPKYTIE